MDAECRVYYSQAVIDDVTRQGEHEGRSDSDIYSIMARDAKRQIKEGQLIHVSTVGCEVRPTGHEQVDPQQIGRLPSLGSTGKVLSTDLLWEIRLPHDFPIDNRATITSNGRRFNVEAVVNRHTDAEFTRVIARSVH